MFCCLKKKYVCLNLLNILNCVLYIHGAEIVNHIVDSFMYRYIILLIAKSSFIKISYFNFN